ncbi:C-type lectin BpLec-like [Pungitius pungitius]|uniref:C-type lectin BpLec-like n=1 Tax=Pungitius pungitius TaxID=134920 RepID=UPI001888DCF0|nr:C-type lectin BpLec-like [Pungitius pungitius]
MLLLLFLLGLALGAVCPSEDPPLQLQRGDCPTFWFTFNGRCYKYFATRMNWADAELYCLSLGTNLVSIHSEEEQSFVEELIKNFDPAEGNTWLGLSDNHKEGAWMWTDGSKVEFTYWGPEQPDNEYEREHCVQTNYLGLKSWYDWPCSHNVPFVCASRLSSS